MHVISRRRLVAFGGKHADSDEPLDRWYRLAKQATWANFAELRADFPHADQVGQFTGFNIRGNKYRLIAIIYFDDQVLLVRRVMTHAEYDRDAWK